MLTDNGVVSLIGAGGKTTLMFRLAARLAGSGKKVLTTTTTRILQPLPGQSPRLILSPDAGEILSRSRDAFRRHSHVTAGREQSAARGKVLGLDPAVIDQLRQSALYDWIIVEADGAARRPLKTCARHEPVVSRSTTHIVAVAGLSAVGRPLTDATVFRAEQFSRVTALPLNMPVTAGAMARALVHDLARADADRTDTRRIVFLNQADLPGAEATGQQVAGLIQSISRRSRRPVDRILLGALRRSTAVRQWYPGTRP